MAASFQPLTISIVGAGIGGLTAAVALRRNGHRIQIFEAAQNKAEIVANLTVQINALRVLDHLGVLRDNLNGLPMRGSMLYSSNGGEGITRPWLAPGVDENGLICHRSDLYEELKRLATGEGEGPPAQLRLGTKVVACDIEEGTVTLDGGEVVHADFILGADGIHSIIRAQMLGSVGKAQNSGLSCFRVVFDAANLRDIPELEWLYTGVFSESAIRWIRKTTLAAWTPTATLEEFFAKFRDFDPKFQHVLDLPMYSPIHRWTLRVLPLLSTWVLGRAALLGDAAHATLPFLGQGAGMGIEEAGALGCLLPAGTRREDVPARLRAYEYLRKQRGDFVNTESIKQASQCFAFLGCLYSHVTTAEEIHRYLLAYDAVKAAEECYQEALGGGSLVKLEPI
ncbi:hypothetical protein K438DRAFT_1784700 [Mycena galopus ATCC 62051]|nr:hypothetical protein K438DRAFT_1784700 [Mycena galopus ATCC 62051]